jgi:serine protease Do
MPVERTWSQTMTRTTSFLAMGVSLLAGITIGAGVFGTRTADRQDVVASPAPAEEGPRARSDSLASHQRESALVQATRKASPSVVGIAVTSKEVVRTRYRDPFFDLFFGEPPAQVRKAQSWGSGVVVDAKGYVLTNFHVVASALESDLPAEIQVTLPDGRGFAAKVLGGDRNNDLAVLKIEGKDLPVAIVSKDPPTIGEWVLAIGNPYGYLIDDPRPSVTVGVLSAADRSFTPRSGIALRHVLQTDAAINPGNSGGALVNSIGEVIGINTFIFTGGGESSGSIGLGFAIPITRAMRIVDEIVQFGRVRDFTTGLSTDPGAAAAMGLRRGDGVLVSEVEPGSPGDKAGLQPGDVIVGVDGRRVSDLEEVRSLLRLFRVGDSVPLRHRRGKAELSASLVLEEAKKRR